MSEIGRREFLKRSSIPPHCPDNYVPGLLQDAEHARGMYSAFEFLHRWV